MITVYILALLALTYLANYTRPVPQEVQDIKQKVDALCIFDNWVVLHYDPKNENNMLTQEEIRKKRDPILFGVLGVSRKLYMIADWKDDHCDLTWEELAGLMSRKGITDNTTLTLQKREDYKG